MKGIMKEDFIISYILFISFLYFLFLFFSNFSFNYNENNIVKPNILFDYISKINCKLCYSQNNTTYYMIFDLNKLKNLSNCSEYIAPYYDPNFYFSVELNNQKYNCTNKEYNTLNKYIRYIGVYDNGDIKIGKVTVYA